MKMCLHGLAFLHFSLHSGLLIRVAAFKQFCQICHIGSKHRSYHEDEYQGIFQGNQLEDYLDADINSLDEETIVTMIEAEQTNTTHGEELKFIFNVPCWVHTMQLSLHDVFMKQNSEWEQFLKRCRDLVVDLRAPKIYNIIVKRGLPVPLLYSDVRWSSIHGMVSSSPFNIIHRWHNIYID